MASQTFICNIALANVGKPSIDTINEASAEGVACKLFYAHVLEALLQSYPWRFARKTEAMAEVANVKQRWLKAYARPSDCLKILMVTDEAEAEYLVDTGDGLIVQGGFAYDVEGDTIYCDVAPAYLVYTRSATDPARFPAMFIEAFGWHLAVRLAMPLTRDPKLRADAYQLAMRTTATAEALDANEVRESSDKPSGTIEARS